MEVGTDMWRRVDAVVVSRGPRRAQRADGRLDLSKESWNQARHRPAVLVTGPGQAPPETAPALSHCEEGAVWRQCWSSSQALTRSRAPLASARTGEAAALRLAIRGGGRSLGYQTWKGARAGTRSAQLRGCVCQPAAVSEGGPVLRGSLLLLAPKQHCDR